METQQIVIIAVAIIVAVVGAGLIYLRYRTKNMNNMFMEIREMVKQAPKSKKNSFLLFMFRESINSAKDKKNTDALQRKLNNSKYVNIQLVQMSKALKDRSSVTDKTVKKALNLYDSYLRWEKSESKKAV